MAQKNIYLVAKYFAQPRKKGGSSVAGYMKVEGNVKWDEQINITRGLKDKDIPISKIILNITEQKVVKNGFQNGRSFAELFEYFYKNNTQELAQALQQVGISVEQKEIPQDGQEHVSEDVSTQEEAGSGSTSTAETQPTVA